MKLAHIYRRVGEIEIGAIHVAAVADDDDDRRCQIASVRLDSRSSNEIEVI